jgi:hypothetical protein
MRMMIRYQSGLRVEAVLLAANSERMRVAIETQRDTVELHRVDGCWYTQRGAAIEIEALISLRGARTPACRAETPSKWRARRHGLACR